MNEAMEQVKDIMERVATQAARKMQYEIAKRIEVKARTITRLLDNGETIYFQTSEKRFFRMNQLRNSLRTKEETLYTIVGMIYCIDISNVKY